jgi:diguanylate cyclase (GGDEF)-like protein/PAS domain S-box-containing protein
MQVLNNLRRHAFALLVVVLAIIATLLAFWAAERVAQERAALHAEADARQYQRTLQQGINAYLHLTRDFDGYMTVAALPSQRQFETYARTANVLDEYPGLSYIGYVQRDPNPGGADRYPNLFAYPETNRALSVRGLDFAAVPARWTAMQLARDTGLLTATAKHAYMVDPRDIPIVVIFAPVYDAALPSSSAAERRLALRGYVYSILEIEEMIERTMGPQFRERFDLEIYDGALRKENLLYDGDKRPHVLQDPDLPLSRHAEVVVANRNWNLFFFPKAFYANRYRGWAGRTILFFGLVASVALGLLADNWTRRQRRIAQKRSEELRFEEVFERHPSAVFALDARGRFVNANTQALRELKVDKAALNGKPIDVFVVGEEQSKLKHNFEKVLEGHSVSYDTTFVDAGGHRIEASITLLAMLQGDHVAGVLGIAENVTERKLNEWRLRESKQMLKLVINNIPQRVFWKDTQLNYLGCNEAFSSDAGLATPEEIIGKSDFDLMWNASADAYRSDDLATITRNEARINYEERQVRDDGTETWLRTSKIPLSGMDGRTVGLLGLYEDITEQKLLERQLTELAHYDSLTGLANRASFYHHLELVSFRTRRRPSLVALLYLDLDKFKSVNDSYGHDVGDSLLKAFALRIKAAVRDTDMAARLGGDEFAVLLEDLPDRSSAISVATKLLATMEVPFPAEGIELMSGTSIGIAFLDPGGPADELVRRADQAMYAAKRSGRGRYFVDAG